MKQQLYFTGQLKGLIRRLIEAVVAAVLILYVEHICSRTLNEMAEASGLTKKEIEEPQIYC